MGRLEFSFKDYKGRPSQFGVLVRDERGLSDVIAYANRVRDAFIPLTNAAFIGAKYQLDVDVSPFVPPAIDSDVYRRLLILFRDNNNAASVTLPSPGPLPLDTVGPLRAIRLGMDGFSMPSLQTLVQLLRSDTVTQWGATFPTGNNLGAILRGVE